MKLILFEPGFFPTSAFEKLSSVPSRLLEYAELNAVSREAATSMKSRIPGDVNKGVDRMIEIVKGTGMTAGKTVPLRVPLGSDVLAPIKAKYKETLRICEEWKEVALSTDITPSS